MRRVGCAHQSNCSLIPWWAQPTLRLIVKQANPTGLAPVDPGLCTTFVPTRIGAASSAETREPPGQARWGRWIEVWFVGFVASQCNRDYDAPPPQPQVCALWL